MQRTPLEQNPLNTIELVTSNGIITLTILGFINAKLTPPPALVCGYLTDNALAPTITCDVSEARRLAAHILRAADTADDLTRQLAKARGE